MSLEAVSNYADIPIQYETTQEPTAMRESALRARVSSLTEAGVELKTIAVEAKVHSAELKRWDEGKDEPGVAMALTLWLEVIDAEASLAAGDFVETPTAKRILKAFEQARQDKDGEGRRGMCLIYGASGAGKTETAEYYEKTENLGRKHGSWSVVYVRVDEKARTFPGLLQSVSDALVENGVSKNWEQKPIDTILYHVPEGGLLIIDEAHFLPNRRLDELRIFPDKHKIAVAFLGNMAGYKKLESEKIVQITRRVGGSRVIIDTPCEGDVNALLEAWGIGGRKVREMAVKIGTQDGGLGVLFDIVRQAKIFSTASGKSIDEDLFKVAAFSVGAWGAEQ